MATTAPSVQTQASASFVPPVAPVKILDFAVANNFVDYADDAVLKTSENGVRYLTLINDKNEALNVFFGKKAGEQIAAEELASKKAQPVNDLFLSKLSVWMITNEAGEARLKAFISSASKRRSIAGAIDFVRSLTVQVSMEATAHL